MRSLFLAILLARLTTAILTTQTFYSCTIPAQATSVPAYFTTIYTTAYAYICPTGLAMTTYTITESAPGYESDYVTPTGAPPGFTVTTTVCAACKGAPTVTVTIPATPATQISDGQVQASPAAQISDGQVQAPSAAPNPATPVAQISDGQLQQTLTSRVTEYATVQPTQTVVVPEATSVANTTVSTPGSSDTLVPFTGGVASNDVLIWSIVGAGMLAVVGALAGL